MPPRLYVPHPIAAGTDFGLGDAATRHAQVLRLQPDDEVILFDGRGGQWRAHITVMAKREARVQALVHDPIERELPICISVAVAMPAGERMDFLVEKATELGAKLIQPLVADRSVLRLAGERADKRRAHWQALATAACEQCGRNRVPAVQPVAQLAGWLVALGPLGPLDQRWLLGWRDAKAWPSGAKFEAGTNITLLSGPEGGFTDAEEAAARSAGFVPTTLGSRVLRADTAPLAALAALALGA